MKRVPVIMLVAWAVFVSSWFLPVVKGGGTLAIGVIPGWEAFRAALEPTESWLVNAFSIGSALSNGLMLLSGVILLTRRPTQRVPGWLAWGFVVAMAVDLFWVWRLEFTISVLRVGYWSWVASFGLSAVALLSLRWLKVPAAAV